MSIEAMKQALDALELNNTEWKDLADSGDITGYWKAEEQDHFKQTQAAITSLRQAIKELESQEPVAWRSYGKLQNGLMGWRFATDRSTFHDDKEQQPLYTHPPQRKPLTDEQIAETFCKAPHQTQHVAWFAAGVRYAEAAHGIKEES